MDKLTCMQIKVARSIERCDEFEMLQDNGNSGSNKFVVLD